jgi:hypothetical protein
LTSADLRALPLELMFPRNLLLRGWAFGRLFAHHEPPGPVRPLVCRWRARKDHLLEAAAQRTSEAVSNFLNGCGSNARVLPAVQGTERALPFPFPLFSSKFDNASYASKYPFCDFFDIGMDLIPDREFALYIFTYGDFCEMPLVLHDMITKLPFAFFMFIPAQFIREAFGILGPIFERQARRVQYAKEKQATGSDKDMRTMALHCAVATVPYDFITLVQATLIHSIGCPVMCIAPGQRR